MASSLVKGQKLPQISGLDPAMKEFSAGDDTPVKKPLGQVSGFGARGKTVTSVDRERELRDLDIRAEEENTSRALRLALVLGVPVLIAVVYATFKIAGVGAAIEDEGFSVKDYPQEELQALSGKLIGAASFEELVPHVRNADVVVPRMREYYAQKPFVPQEIVEFGQGTSILDVGDEEFAYHTGKTKDDRWHTFAYFASADGPKLDWESLVRYQKPTLEEFMKQGDGTTNDFLVWISISDYYNYDFSVEKDFQCFDIESPSEDFNCYAYVSRKKKNEIAQKLHNRFTSHAQLNEIKLSECRLKCVLTLEIPPSGGERRQLLIRELVSETWVKP